MGAFNNVHIFEPVKIHIYESNMSLSSLISLMVNCAKPRMIALRFRLGWNVSDGVTKMSYLE